eukprot:3795101-Rhodomonas_salina.1
MLMIGTVSESGPSGPRPVARLRSEASGRTSLGTLGHARGPVLLQRDAVCLGQDQRSPAGESQGATRLRFRRLELL